MIKPTFILYHPAFKDIEHRRHFSESGATESVSDRVVLHGYFNSDKQKAIDILRRHPTDFFRIDPQAPWTSGASLINFFERDSMENKSAA
jgi:hypothetical protein